MAASSSSNPDFNILDPNTLSLKQWNQHLENHLEAKYGQQEGHQYICINDQEQLALFESKKAAKQAGFTKNISLSKIIEITTEKMSTYKGYKSRYTAQALIKSIIYRKLAKIDYPKKEHSVGLQILCCIKESEPITPANLNAAITDAQSLFIQKNPYGNIITPEIKKLVMSDLSTASSLTRSLHGNSGGVYFIENSSLILKIRANPFQHILADRFFQIFGFETAHYSCLHRDSKFGKQAFEKLESLDEEYSQSAIAAPSSPKPSTKQASKKTKSMVEIIPTHENDVSEVDDNKDILQTTKIQKDKKVNTDDGLQLSDLLKMSYIMVMKKAPGITFAKLSKEQITIALSQETVLQAIGKMIFLDFFIGNRDRISTTNCNSGNFLLTSEHNNPISLIDHDFNLSKNTFDMFSIDMTLLLSKESNPDIVQTLIERLKNGLQFGRGAIELDIAHMTIHISQGIQNAATYLIETFSEKKYLVYQILDIPDLSQVPDQNQLPVLDNLPDRKTFFEMLNLVKNLLKNYNN